MSIEFFKPNKPNSKICDFDCLTFAQTVFDFDYTFLYKMFKNVFSLSLMVIIYFVFIVMDHSKTLSMCLLHQQTLFVVVVINTN
jgi:hypothetical protein